MNEAAARIKINKLLEAAGWRFFDTDGRPANIRLEANVKFKASDLDALGENFEKTSSGSIDFLLLDDKGFPLIVLEAKREDLSPLTGKEQARKYARSQNCRFIILSNGNLHYFWDLQRGNPHLITALSHAGLSAGLSPRRARFAAPGGGNRSRRLHRPQRSVRAMSPKRPGATKPSAPPSSRLTSCASCAPTSCGPFMRCSGRCRTAMTDSSLKWPPAPARP